MKQHKATSSILAALLAAAMSFAAAGSGAAQAKTPTPSPAATPTAPSRLSGPLVAASFPADSGLSDYAKTGLASMSTFQLSNGIPVVVKRNSASPIRHISLVLRGGSAAATPDKAGYELLALKTMARGGSKFSYADIQNLLDEMSASLGAGANLDYATYSLTCLSKYFDRLFPLWTDTLLAPSFKPQDFAQELSQAKLALQSREKDPWQKTALATNAAFFVGHPYAVAPEGTKESLAAASLDAVKAWYSNAFSADRMFIVAVGDYDVAALQKDLEAALAGIPDHKVGLPAKPPKFAGDGPGKLVKVEFPASRGIAYLRGDFAAPSPDQADFMAASIGVNMLEDLLNDVVRNQHGAVYTPSAYLRASVSNYGSITMYKTNMPGKIKAYIDEALRDLLAGNVLDVGSGATPVTKAAAPRTGVAKVLDIYKAQFTNRYFEKLGTNAQVAGLIIQSVISAGDCRTWLLDAQRIDAVSASDVSAAVAKYLGKGQLTWVVLSSRDMLVPVVDADYEAFNTK